MASNTEEIRILADYIWTGDLGEDLSTHHKPSDEIIILRWFIKNYPKLLISLFKAIKECSNEIDRANNFKEFFG